MKNADDKSAHWPQTHLTSRQRRMLQYGEAVGTFREGKLGGSW